MSYSPLAENLKASIQQAERYTLLALSSSVVFVALSLPNPITGGVLEWKLLGVPLTISPPLALFVLYVVYFSSCLLADNMIIHTRDLVEILKTKERMKIDQIRAIFSYPTILTVSPLGRYFGTFLPGVFVVLGIFKLHIQGVYELPPLIWYLSYGFGLVGFLVFVRIKLGLTQN